MIDQEPTLPEQKKQYWRYLPVLIVLALAVYILLPTFANLQHAWDVVKDMTWWAVILAGVAEIISWIGNGIVISAILANKNHKLSIGKGSLIALGTLSLSLAAGGGVGLAAMVSWIRRETHDGHIAFLAGTLPAFLNNGVLFAVSMFGTIYLLFVGFLKPLQVVEFSLVLLILGVITALVFLAFRSKRTAKKLFVWVNQKWSAIRHQPFSLEKSEDLVDEFFLTVASLRNGGWVLPLLGAVINVGFDMLAFYLFFIAAGKPINIGDVFAGYGFPLAMGKLAFILPAGVGVVEATMVSVLTKLEVAKEISVVVIMGYRLFSMWLPTVVGFVAAAYLSGKLFHPAKSKIKK